MAGRVWAVAVLLAGGLVLSACNTISGMGMDVSNAGHAVSDEAQKVKQHL
jgi:predicted small secreted protein